jgi:GT2 family glycosyltransferase
LKYHIEELKYQNEKIKKKIPTPITSSNSRIAIVIHLYYPDLWEEIEAYLSKIVMGYDLFITVPPHITDTELLPLFESQPNIHLYMTENRGRDVLPFLQIMKLIGINTYDYICKMHSKKTKGSALGQVWRKLLYYDLIGSSKIVEDIVNTFDSNPKVGMLTGKNTILDSQRYTYGNNDNIKHLAELTGMIYDEYYLFPAGTMFWTRPEIIAPIVKLFNEDKLDFEEEAGQTENTLAHAIERFFGVITQVQDKEIIESSAPYSSLLDSTLNEVGALVLSQQYVGNNVFASQKVKIEDQNKYIAYLEELVQSMRIKNRIKNLAKDKILPLGKKIAKIPQKAIQVAKVAKNNPALLKKVWHYAKRGELKYLLNKIREKSANNLSTTQELVEVKLSEYFTELDTSKYTLNDIIIDIIIPVYNGYEFLEPLFDSVEQHTTPPYRLIVINDCSPDERVKPYLHKRLEKHPTAIFIDHRQNQGFLKSVNEAYTHTSSHFVLLNTDTEVPSFWLERLMYPILHMKNISSTTPFTNSGEIASFPNFVADNPIFDGLSVEDLDANFKEINPNNFYAEVPTGVGFCMGVNYETTKEIGMFVENTFGKGYGEENDWCQRAIQKGYKNLIVPNLFVYHKHGGSFSAEEKQKLLEKNAVTLLERHPNYGIDVNKYLEKNPHDILRKLLVLRASNSAHSTHLIFDHALGGGANLYTNERIKSYIAKEKNILLVKYDFYSHCYILTHKYKGYDFSFKITALEDLQTFIDSLTLSEIFLNNLVSYKNPEALLSYIHSLVSKTNAKLIVPIHDAYSICPSYNLLSQEGKYCDVPNLETCKACMQSNMQEWRNFYDAEVDINSWRASWEKILLQSSEILTFSNSSKNILLKAYPNIANKITVIPHEVKDIHPIIVKKNANSATTTIGVLGAINHVKGAEIIKQLVQIIERDNLDINIVVIGEITESIQSKHFHVTGRYERDKLSNLVQEHQIDIFLIPTIIPETFSYTTQEIIMMELPLMVFNLGAPAERVASYNKGVIIDEISATSVLAQVKKLYS